MKIKSILSILAVAFMFTAGVALADDSNEDFQAQQALIKNHTVHTTNVVVDPVNMIR